MKVNFNETYKNFFKKSVKINMCKVKFSQFKKCTYQFFWYQTLLASLNNLDPYRWHLEQPDSSTYTIELFLLSRNQDVFESLLWWFSRFRNRVESTLSSASRTVSEYTHEAIKKPILLHFCTWKHVNSRKYLIKKQKFYIFNLVETISYIRNYEIALNEIKRLQN